jgi:hypothetical protein
MDRETPNPSVIGSTSARNNTSQQINAPQEYLTLQPLNQHADAFSGTADLNRGSDSSIFHAGNFMANELGNSNFKDKERSSTYEKHF